MRAQSQRYTPALFRARSYLLARSPEARLLASALRFHPQTIILPSYDRESGKTVSTDRDWVGYFSAARGRMGEEGLGEPESMPGARLRIDDRTCGEIGYHVQPLDWEGQESWEQWIGRTVMGRMSCARNNFQSLRTVDPDP